MKYILLMLLMISCDKNYNYKTYECQGGYCSENYNTGEEESEVEFDMSGYYEMPFGGYFELVKLNDGRYWIYQQLIFSQNYDGGIAYHPNMSAGPHVLQANNTIRYAQNHNYSDITHDVERDGATSNITGLRRTEYILGLNSNDLFEYEVTIREDTSLIGNIQVRRTITEE